MAPAADHMVAILVARAAAQVLAILLARAAAQAMMTLLARAAAQDLAIILDRAAAQVLAILLARAAAQVVEGGALVFAATMNATQVVSHLPSWGNTDPRLLHCSSSIFCETLSSVEA